MTNETTRTTESLESPHVPQFSVFLENKVGALLDLTRLLGQSNIHICGISVVDTADSSVVRMVVDDPDHCRKKLQEAKLRASESHMLVVELPTGPEGLAKVLSKLVAAEVNILHTYSLMVRPRGQATLAMLCEDPDYARDVLLQAGNSVLSQKDIAR